ncbi:hypothetical protein [Absidia glauca]|uniref:Uncharacterized protein n=1 Tax=Absidia glauca TaxID=4829 RepID=A0A168PPQ8_ABSGL|nr:hypothetical protein [Absidia glauca]
MDTDSSSTTVTMDQQQQQRLTLMESLDRSLYMAEKAVDLDGVMDRSSYIAEKALDTILAEFQQLVIDSAQEEAFEKNQRIHDRLKRRVESIQQQLASYKGENVIVPKNLPCLQLIGDTDTVKTKVCFETIDKFFLMFELIAHQHHINLDLSWEPFDMRASRYENPVRFVDGFATTLRSTGVTDSVGYGTILLKALRPNHQQFVQQIRLAYAAAPRVNRPEMTVDYINEVAPILATEDPVEPQQGGPNLNRTGNRPRYPSRHQNGSNNRNQAGPSRPRPYSIPTQASPSSKQKEKVNESYHCHKPWDPKHRCQEFLQKEAEKFAARMAKLQLEEGEGSTRKV